MGKPIRSDILLQARDKTCHGRRNAEQILSALLTESYLTKVLNDIKATSTLLDKRGDIYSSRPRFVVAYNASSGLLVRITRVIMMIAPSSSNPSVAALCFPEITRRIHTELDSLVGRDRLPIFDDECSLPFLGASIKEVTRCAFSVLRSRSPMTL